MIQVERLRKSFGSLVAVDDVSFTVAEGEIFGLLGPNGAGKTTAINMICGILKPDGGRVLIGGKDIWLEARTVKQGLAVVPQEIAVYEDLNARDNLNFWGSLYGLSGSQLRSRVDETLTRVGLSDRAADKVKSFSGGMKRRLNLCMGLLHRPRVLLLDEPTVGIDPQARLNILDVVREVASTGTTVLYTTHYMDEAQELCDRIAIIDHGEIVASGTPASLKREISGEVVIVGLDGDPAPAGEVLSGQPYVRTMETHESTLRLSVADGATVVPQIMRRLDSAQISLNSIEVHRPSLDDVFLAKTGRSLRED
jgi:ABC-2 type transport system ATP-binding protein